MGRGNKVKSTCSCGSIFKVFGDKNDEYVELKCKCGNSKRCKSDRVRWEDFEDNKDANNMSEEDMLIIEKSIRDIGRISKKYGRDLLYNYFYRELATKESVKVAVPDLKISKKSAGKKFDAIDNSGKKYEFKSATVKKLQDGRFSPILRWEFDKQNDSKRRTETLEYDAFVFSAFSIDSFFPEFQMIINDGKQVRKMKYKIREKQEVFVKEVEEADKSNKRISRDSISFTLLDLLELFDDDNIIILDKNRTTIGMRELKKRVKIKELKKKG